MQGHLLWGCCCYCCNCCCCCCFCCCCCLQVSSCASLQLALVLRRHRPMLPVVISYTADFAARRLAAVLQQGEKQAAEACLSLLEVYRQSRRHLPARFKYRRHELQQQQQQQQLQQLDGAAPAHTPRQLPTSRTAVRARELLRLLLHKRGSSSSSNSSSSGEGQQAEAAARVYDLLLPPKFAAGLQAVYRALLFLSELIFKE